MARVFVDEAARAEFIASCASGQPERVPRLIASIVVHWAAKVPSQANATLPQLLERAMPVAAQMLNRMRTHSGPAVASAVPAPRAAEPTMQRVQPRLWVRTASSEPQKRRKVPEPDARVRKIMAELRTLRLGSLPPDAVVCPERAYGRVVDWRRKVGAGATAPPPMALLRALVHDGADIPTLTGSAGDHYWLLADERWVTPDELMNLFAVPPSAPLRRLLAPECAADALAIARAMGRAVYPICCENVLRQALQATTLPSPVYYASACSGIDLFPVALDHVLGPEAWLYVHASEIRPRVADALAYAYAPRGLTSAAIVEDATSEAAGEWAPPADIWVCTPPCEAFSRRNHARSDSRSLATATAFDAMLDYPRHHRPRVIVVENVAEIDAHSVISAGLASLPGYTFLPPQQLDAAQYGPMARARRYWVGWLS